MIDNSNPMHLNELLLRYPDTPFDLFHLGWPYTDEALALVKIHANATLDFCWAHIISPRMAVRVLGDAMDTLPINKILMFGGDYFIPDLVYGHAKLAKRNLARALANAMEEGVMGEPEALDCASKMLYSNAKARFSL